MTIHSISVTTSSYRAKEVPNTNINHQNYAASAMTVQLKENSWCGLLDCTGVPPGPVRGSSSKNKPRLNLVVTGLSEGHHGT